MGERLVGEEVECLECKKMFVPGPETGYRKAQNERTQRFYIEGEICKECMK